MSTAELQLLVADVGAGRAAQLKAAIELGMRVLTGDLLRGRQIKRPADIVDLLLLEMSHLDQEHLRTVLLDTHNRVQAICTVYIGSLNASMVRVCEVFKEAVRHNSAALIVAHNHPSGQATPSPEDVLVTREIVAAGQLLDIDVLDHLVIGHGTWVSLRERGLGFEPR
jgi:DNA repair protein RadC